MHFCRKSESLRLELNNKLFKKPGVSEVEINGRLERFMANESEHPEIEQIMEYILNLSKK